MTFHYIKHYLRYLLCSRHWRGYGVHSPFAFDLVTNVIREELPYYKYSLVEKIRGFHQNSKQSLPLTGGEASVSTLSKDTSLKPSKGQLLFRLVNKYKPSHVVETKMGLAISTMYLAAPDTRLSVTTFEKERSVVNYATQFMKQGGFSNIQVIPSSPEESLKTLVEKLESLDFLYVNDCHSGAELDERLSICLPKAGDKSVFVVDNIYEDETKTEAWNRLKSMSQVRVTVDLFHLGIAFFDRKLQKEDYFVRHFPDFHL